MFALAIGCGAPSSALAAKQKPAAKAPAPTTPAPTPAARPDSTVLTAVAPSGVALTPGPLVTPGSPIADRSTITPFPIPGDTGRAARERAKTMNIPRAGLTLAGPLPQDDRRIRFIGPFKGGFYVPYQGEAFELPEQVDILPEQLTQPAPEYPKAAIDAHIQGIVAVMAHVLADGTVGETHVLKSIPALDSAAVQSVRRLRFKPASRQGKPVAVWLGVPVRFTIH
jgi:protein TonB